MSNHRWVNNVCTKCGISRERKEYRRWQSTGSFLGRDGCWHDRHYYTYGTAWYYGEKYGFDRPQCALVELLNKEQEQDRSVANTPNSSNGDGNLTNQKASEGKNY